MMITDFPPDSTGANTQNSSAGGSQTTGGQWLPDTQNYRSAGSQNSPDHRPFDAQAGHVRGSTSTNSHEEQSLVGGFLRDPVLGVLADVVDDFETVRVANENRLRQLTRTETDSDGEERGHGLTVDHPEVAKLAQSVEALKTAEHQAILSLQRSMRKHPLGPWVKAQIGVGEKQAARLLAVIGDPYWNDLYGRPRTVSELWAYCGLHVLHPGSHCAGDTQAPIAAGVAPKRQRGAKANWNDLARKRTWLISASCIKQASSPYRLVYDETRLKYADAVHKAECVRCGPSGKPALVGSGLSDGHKHARAMRAMSKAFLKDLWRESKRLYEEAV